jgi:hypothetical protein
MFPKFRGIQRELGKPSEVVAFRYHVISNSSGKLGTFRKSTSLAHRFPNFEAADTNDGRSSEGYGHRAARQAAGKASAQLF